MLGAKAGVRVPLEKLSPCSPSLDPIVVPLVEQSQTLMLSEPQKKLSGLDEAFTVRSTHGLSHGGDFGLGQGSQPHSDRSNENKRQWRQFIKILRCI